MGNSPGGFEPQGALRECFMTFPQFHEDLPVLLAEGYVKITSPETCVWTKSKTSLAQYFKWSCYDADCVIGGFWAPVSKAFGEPQRRLSRNASPNANPLKKEYSKDFIKIRPVLEKHRKQELLKQNERR
ncbi:MAG: hypothetical protein LBD31_10900, partial [Treponema sp.]|nr:hypothetical protein [Treponema sp.]